MFTRDVLVIVKNESVHMNSRNSTSLISRLFSETILSATVVRKVAGEFAILVKFVTTTESTISSDVIIVSPGFSKMTSVIVRSLSFRYPR
jgi:hypothetical protein